MNVHPTKAEVRFRDQSFIHEVVKHAVADAIGKGAVPELQLLPSTYRDAIPTAQAIPGVLAGGSYPSRWTPDDMKTALSSLGLREPATAVAPIDSESGGLAATAGSPVKPMMPLGQFRDTFIIAVDADGIAIIDQHVAHERVLFERVMERLSSGRLESQRLLEPLLVELSVEGRQALLSHAEDLDRLGFGVEDFGGDTVRMTALPALLGGGDAVTAVRALAEDLEGLDRGGPGRRRAAPDCRHHGVPRGGEGELPADAREDAAHPRRASPHRLLDRVPARPAGDAAPHQARNREEFSADMKPGALGAALYYLGRLLQAIAMWVLLVDVFTAGPMGPQPNPFYAGVAMFVVGLFLVRSQSKAS